MRAAPLLLLLIACAGPAEETLVDELRVLAVVAEPPEVRPGESTTVSSLVVDPVGDGFDVVSWTCLPLGDGCLEASADAWPTARVDRAADRWTDHVLTAPLELAAVASPQPLPLVLHWTLACTPGDCPVIDAIEAGGGADFLADPTAGMADLPLEGTSLALRTIDVSTRATPATSPTVACTPALPAAIAGEPLPFTCAVGGDFADLAAVWGYGTAGGWGGASRDLAPGATEVAYEWYAPEDFTGEADLWVVIVDGRGGLGVWEGSVTVTAP